MVGEIRIARALQEVARQRHAILQRDVLARRCDGHGVHELLAGGEVARRNGRARQPILLVGANAGGAQITHPARPQFWIGGHVARDRMAGPVRTARIDPTVVGDQRQPKLGLEGGKAIGEQLFEAS